MKKILKVVEVILGLVALGGVIAGVVDRREERRREQEGKSLHNPYGPYEKYLKRPFDFMLSAVAIVVLSPLLLIIALLVRVKLGSPVLFSQQRPGRDEKIFTLRKFRSMTSDVDEDGELLPDTERLTPFGIFLRFTSLDELPEFFNIFKGDMSIIGPRPLLERYLKAYTTEEKHRHDVRPGLTGLAQTSGRNNLNWDDRLACDVKYVHGITFMSDATIFLRSILQVLKKQDVAVDTFAADEGYLDEVREIERSIDG